DLPSGVDADTGEVAGDAVRADVTVTFGTYKPGLLIDPAHAYAGALRLCDIGLELPPRDSRLEALQHDDVAALLP
ncbi:bifunctional ADP-dependent NAD(P)H-hydrate dehydratase/NAD(P)H-hydrate epimerase, partial [Streptomyces sp. SID14478]|uniref:NAD(P)H-hydrate epimerase n=1 Tax=Streptomyces sp. SID14478 TaxID=2706073 RepID=UPI00141096CB